MINKKKAIISVFIIGLLFCVSAINTSAFSVPDATRFINELQRIADDDSDAAPFEIGNAVSGLFCGCATTNSCEGILAGLCVDLTNPVIIDSEGLRWASFFLSNPEAGMCSVIKQGLAYDLGLSVDNTNRNASFQRTPNAYLEAARTFNDETLEYTYFFSFNFFPTEEYSSEDVSFHAKKGADRINLNIPVLPPSDQGFRHRKIIKNSELYDEACMKFNTGNPRGFSRNELCVKVTQI